MKTKFFIRIVLACFIFTGCSSITRAPNVPTISQTPAASSTKTPLPTATLRELFTETPTAVPTLRPEQAKEAIQDLLLNNASCLAPCFMNIVPGQTTFEEANAFFTHLGLDLQYSSTQGNMEFYEAAYRFGTSLSFSIRLITQSGIVKNLDIPITIPKDQKGSNPQEWADYSLNNIINKYGPPSKVNFFVGRGPTPSYSMDVYYDANDLIIEYSSYDLGKKLQICPYSDQLTSIRLWLGENPISPPLDTVLLEEATSMTMEEFSKLMTGDPQKACFNLKEEMFP
jgi:hypothetical protein